jgi:hypothetical protein
MTSNLIIFEPLGSRAKRGIPLSRTHLEYLQSRHRTRGLAQVLNNRVVLGDSSIWIMGRALEYSLRNMRLWL